MVRNHKYLGVICYCSTGRPAQLGRGPVGHSGWQVQAGNTCWGNHTEVPAGKCHLQQPAYQLDGLPNGTHGDRVAIFLSLPCQFSRNPGDRNSCHRSAWLSAYYVLSPWDCCSYCHSRFSIEKLRLKKFK